MADSDLTQRDLSHLRFTEMSPSERSEMKRRYDAFIGALAGSRRSAARREPPIAAPGPMPISSASQGRGTAESWAGPQRHRQQAMGRSNGASPLSWARTLSRAVPGQKRSG